ATGRGSIAPAGPVTAARPIAPSEASPATARSVAAADVRSIAPAARSVGATAWPISTASYIGPVGAAAWLQNLIAAAATEVHTVLRTAGDSIAIATKFLRDVGISVAYALAMRWIVCPVVAAAAVDVVDVDVAIDVDVVAAPIHAAAP